MSRSEPHSMMMNCRGDTGEPAENTFDERAVSAID
jgi:hypothetical protein